MSGIINDKDEEFKKKVKKAQIEKGTAMMSANYKRYWKTDELGLLHQKAKDEVLGYYIKMLPIWIAIPEVGGQILQQFQFYDKSLTDFNKIIKYVEDWIEYNHAIRTEEEFEIQYARAEKILYYEGIQLPLVLMFDYQVHNWSSVLEKPTFYSYYDANFVNMIGKGTFFVAFPSTIAHLTDDELMVVLKHEFGHIVQGHCSVHSSDPFDANYQNAAMDISINCGMTPKEQGLLVDAAGKLFGMGKYPCLSLIGPKEQGGFNIKKPVQPGAWTDALSSIRLYYKKGQNSNQQQSQQNQKGQPQQGQGSGEGGGGEGQMDDKIRIGDPVITRDSNNKIYGRVTAIDETTGEVAEIEEMTKEEFDEWGKKVAEGTF